MKKPKKHEIYVHDDAGEETHVVYSAEEMDKYLSYIFGKITILKQLLEQLKRHKEAIDGYIKDVIELIKSKGL